MLSASAAAEKIRLGEHSAVDLVEASLARIEALDAKLEAWVEVDAAGARLAARQRYEASKHGAVSGALFGVPVGIKDIFDVGGMPTRANAPQFAHHLAEADSAVVARLRDAGAVIFGKTATTQFAYSDPAPTRNPWNLDHTPGGSSSGSAAAVAAGMVPIAIGSQTVGSVLRPAAYCGIVGLKPSYGRVSIAGCVPLAWSLDHVGIFSRSVLDAALTLDTVAGFDPADPNSIDASLESCVAAVRRPTSAPVIGLPRRFYSDTADAEISAHLDEVRALLEKSGASVREVEMPTTPQGVLEIGLPVMRSEAAAYHQQGFAQHADEFRPRIRRLVEQGLGTPAVDYIAAQRRRRWLRDGLVALLHEVDALLLPVAPSTAPAGLDSTGDPVFCAPASFTGLPSIALPSGLSGSGLPLAVQLVARPLAEPRLLSAAAWVERILGFDATPPL
jgi:aspartyl-tRNA(Asn)/glutamyl-tRNA(Gln) amidotransferase subunit A